MKEERKKEQNKEFYPRRKMKQTIAIEDKLKSD